MHRRYDHANIPIEVLRTFIAVNDVAGNYSKAAQSLGLTQPAVSAQIKRLQRVIGKPLFEKTAKGTELTEHGSMVLTHGRRIVAANDQLMSRARPHRLPNQLRLGIPNWLRRSVLLAIIQTCSDAYPEGHVTFICDRVERLTHDIAAGNLDMALLCDVATPPGLIFDEWWETLNWVKSPKLKLEPGEPVPVITWPGTYSDRQTARALNEAGIQSYVSFSAPDLATRIAATRAGLGILILSESRIPYGVEAFRDPQFPTLPNMRKGVYLRQGIDIAVPGIERAARCFLSAIRAKTSANAVSAKPQTPPPITKSAVKRRVSK